MRLLVIEDNRSLVANLFDYFEARGHALDAAPDGVTGLHLATTQAYDALVLDWMLPRMDGREVLRRLRETHGSDLPVIMLTARDELPDKIAGFRAGADDYLTKPFDPRELLARLRAVQRRVGEQPPRGEAARPVIGFAGWQLDITCRELRSPEGVMIPMSAGEFDLLLVLLEHPQRILTREQLIDLTHGQGHDAYDRSIDVQISRLRRKIEPDSKRPDLIRTVRNGGYMFTAKVSRS